jgi:hypothetical protein
MKTECTEQEGIELLEYAGYTVKNNGETFQVFKGENKYYGFSNRQFLLSPQYIMKHIIIERAFDEGFKAGKNRIRRDIQNLLKTE